MISRDEFPRLTEHNHRITSPPAPEYNGIAGSVGDAERWWRPGLCCPVETDPDDHEISALARAYLALGFEECRDGRPEGGYERVALDRSSLFYSHAARQLPGGKWTSKLGRSEDIEHDAPDDLAGGLYGEVVRFLRRPIRRS